MNIIDGDNLKNMSVTGIMNKELCKLMLWLNNNKLSMNIGQTKGFSHFNTDFK